MVDLEEDRTTLRPKSDPCPVCGANRVMVGYSHLCRVRDVKPARRDPAVRSYGNVAQTEIEALQDEVKRLKTELAKANTELEALRATKSGATNATKSAVTKSGATNVTKGRPRLANVSAAAERMRQSRERRKAQKVNEPTND